MHAVVREPRNDPHKPFYEGRNSKNSKRFMLAKVGIEARPLSMPARVALSRSRCGKRLRAWPRFATSLAPLFSVS